MTGTLTIENDRCHVYTGTDVFNALPEKITAPMLRFGAPSMIDATAEIVMHRDTSRRMFRKTVGYRASLYATVLTPTMIVRTRAGWRGDTLYGPKPAVSFPAGEDPGWDAALELIQWRNVYLVAFDLAGAIIRQNPSGCWALTAANGKESVGDIPAGLKMPEKLLEAAAIAAR